MEEDKFAFVDDIIKSYMIKKTKEEFLAEGNEFRRYVEEESPLSRGLAIWDSMRPTGYYAPLDWEVEQGIKFPDPPRRLCNEDADATEESKASKRKRKSKGKCKRTKKKMRTSGEDAYVGNEDGGQQDIGTPELAFEEELTQLYHLADEGSRALPNDSPSEFYIDFDNKHDRKALKTIRKHHPMGRKFKLKHHQRKVCGRMQELAEKYSGGLLAAKMGTGKTIMMIFRIMRQRAKNPREGPTLVITPAGKVDVWEKEMRACMGPDAKIMIHKGSAGVSKTVFKEYEVVLCSSKQLTSEYARMISQHESFLELRRDFISTSIEIVNARGEIVGYKPVVRRRQAFPIFCMRWRRVVLDEGHCIRNQSTSTFKGSVLLKAKERWLLTGSPFANEYTDVQSYMKFLRIEPFNNDMFFRSYFTKTKKNLKNHRIEVHRLESTSGGILRAALQAVMIRFEKNGAFEGKKVVPLEQLEREIVRVKLDTTGINPRIFPSEKERSKALKLVSDLDMIRTQNFFEFDESGGTMWRNSVLMKHYLPVAVTEQQLSYDTRLQWSNALRKLVNTTRPRPKGAGKVKGHVITHITKAVLRAVHWAAPQAKYASRPATAKSHDDSDDSEYEGDDFQLVSKKERGNFTKNRKKFVKLMRKDGNYHSTKIDKATSITQEHLAQKKGKVLIFCPSLVCLDIMAVSLKKELGVKALRFDGKTTPSKRVRIEAKFQSRKRKSPQVMLVQSAAGSEGLTLAAATLCIFLTPGWNNFTGITGEGRAHRMGQRKRVKCVYIVAMQSIDVRMEEVKELKRQKDLGLLQDDLEELEADDFEVQQGILDVLNRLRYTWTLADFMTEMKESFSTMKEQAKHAQGDLHGNGSSDDKQETDENGLFVTDDEDNKEKGKYGDYDIDSDEENCDDGDAGDGFVPQDGMWSRGHAHNESTYGELDFEEGLYDYEEENSEDEDQDMENVDGLVDEHLQDGREAQDAMVDESD